MAKKKQPYIPFYTGDHIKDTRDLSLEAKGAWVDLVLFMWVKESAGILDGTMADFARMVGTSEGNFVVVLKELCRKNICDVHGDQTKIFKIVCRRLAREAEISAIRSEAVQTRYKTSTKEPTKTVQKSDNDNDNDTEVDNGNELKGSGENSKLITPEVPRGTEDTRDTLADCQEWTDQVIIGNDFIFQGMTRVEGIASDNLEDLARSHLALCSRYGWHKKMNSQQAFRNSLIDHIKKESKQNVTGVTKTGNRNTDHTGGLAADFAARHGGSGTGAAR
jgi:uncharacterized protein YdaU (DUF1376 family)